jgi:hypothetical protein
MVYMNGIDQPSPGSGLNQGPGAMWGQAKDDIGRDPLVDRRTWLAGALTAVGASCLAGEPDQSRSDEDRERQAIEELAAKAGLTAFRTTRTRHYLGIGDASDRFRSLTLRDCEFVAADYLDYYRSRGFEVAMPARRLTVIILADAQAHVAFHGESHLQGSPPRANQGRPALGYYVLSTNRLVVCDLRSAGSSRAAALENLRIIAHEATHQLACNTGLLNRHGDVCRCIAEGFAVYGEKRDSIGRSAPGQLDRRMLDNLSAGPRNAFWFPVAQLLVDDRPFLGPRRKLAYAEAWLLIDYLMNDRTRLEGFRGYLEAIRPRIDPGHRREDAEKYLGDLDRLDRDLRSHAVSLIRGS